MILYLAIAFVAGALLAWFVTSRVARKRLADTLDRLTPAPRRPITVHVKKGKGGRWWGTLRSGKVTVANIATGKHAESRRGLINFVRFHLGYAQVVFPDDDVTGRDSVAALGALDASLGGGVGADEDGQN